MILLALLIGAALGGLMADGPGGALLGAALGVALVHLQREKKRQQRLEQDLQALLLRVDALEAGRSVAKAAKPAVAAPSPAATGSLQTHDGPEDEPSLPPAPKPSPAAPAAPAAPQRPRIEMPAWAQRLAAANTIVKVGLAMLFLGLAFLARFAAEHISVPIELRLTGIGAAGLALLAIGWRLRAKRRAYALLMQGGGVGVLYLTLFASAKVFGLVALGPAFALMLAVALLAALLAVLQNAQPMAVAGSLGGYATPLLLSTGGGRIEVLLAYYLVLGIGVAAVAWGKLWPRLNLLAFGFTAVVAVAWGLSRYTPAHYPMAQGFLIAFWLLFTTILLLPGRRASQPDAWVNGTLLFGVPVLGSGLQYGLLQPDQSAIAVAALVIGVVYIALAAWLRQRRLHGTVFEAFLALGAVFGTLVIPFALSAEATAGAWALEGAGAVWLGLRQQRRRVWGAGLLLMLLGGIGLFGALDGAWGSQHWPSAALNATLLCVGGLLGARFLQRAGVGLQVWGPQALVGWAVLWLQVALHQVISHGLAHEFEAPVRLGATAASAALLLALQARWQWPGVSWPCGLLLPAWLLWGLMNTDAHGAPLAAWGWLALPATLAVQGGVLQRAAPHWPALVTHISHTGSLLGLALLGALQGRHWTAGWGDDWSAWGWLGWLAAPALLLATLLRAQRRPEAERVWPLPLAPRAYAETGAGLLALGLAFWALIANWGSNGNAQPLPHLPLLNPLDLGLAATLLVLTLWLRSPGAARWRLAAPRALLGSVAALGFLWLNGMLIRAFHHWGGVPYRVEGWLHSWGVQTGLALLWSGLALVLMWRSAKRQERTPWLVGAGLLGAVVLKLLAFDLQGTGTVMRIVSFIGVGVLMLVIGYVAPLPGSTDEREDPAR